MVARRHSESSEVKLEKKVEEISSKAQEEVPEKNASSSFDKAVSSDNFIRIIAGLCALLWVVRHDSALFIFFVPFVVALFRRLGSHFLSCYGLGEALGVFDYITTMSLSIGELILPKAKELVHVTIAGPLRQFVRVLFTSDRVLVTTLKYLLSFSSDANFTESRWTYCRRLSS